MKFVRRYKFAGKGWFNEKYRHSLAAKGVKTRFNWASAAAAAPARGRNEGQSEGIEYTGAGFDVGYGQMCGESSVAPGSLSSTASQSEQVAMLKNKLKEMGKSRVEVPEPGTIARKIAGLRSKEQAEKAIVKEPFEETLARIEFGDFSELPGPLAVVKGQSQLGDYDLNRMKLAAFKGALKAANVGSPIDYSKISFLEKAQLDRIRAEERLFKTGKKSTAGERFVGGLAKSAEGLGFETSESVGKLVKKGASELLAGESISERQARLKKTALPAMRWSEEEVSSGVFNPLKIAGIDKVIEAKRGKPKSEFSLFESPFESAKEKELKEKMLYPRAVEVERETNDFFFNKGNFSKADLSAYERGLKSFKVGDWAGVANAIKELDLENEKLKDRFSIVNGTRRKATHHSVAAETVAREGAGGGLMPNFLFGGGGGAKIADQTKRLVEVEKAIQRTSNEAVVKKDILQRKLKKVEANLRPDTSSPEKEPFVKFKGGSSGSLMSFSFDDFHGQFSGFSKGNPALEDVRVSEKSKGE